MKINIKINCDTIAQIHSHLIKIREDLMRETKRRELNRLEDDLPTTVKLDDDNCYGEHTFRISNNVTIKKKKFDL